MIKPTQPRIWLSLAKMGGMEQSFIQQAFDTNWVVPLGPNVNGFEADLERYLGIPSNQVVALASGTSAIHLALIQLGIGPGDEILCQSFTFAASANPIKYLGATPVFVDSERDTWNMDPKALEMAIVERRRVTGKVPKAVVPVHLYGMPAKMDEIMEVAERYGVAVVEDAAEALGSRYKGRFCGTLGDYGVLSFNGNKMITTSGGGALVCPSGEAALRVKFLATQARDDAPHYQHSEVGYNYRLSNICAGIGRGQMLVLDQFVAARRGINRWYRSALADFPGLSFLVEPAGGSVANHDKPVGDFESNHWLTCVLVDPSVAGYSREDLRITMEAANIETRPLWKPMHLQPLYADCSFYSSVEGASRGADETRELPIDDIDNSICGALFRDGLCLPSHPNLTETDLERIMEVFTELDTSPTLFP